MFRNQLARDMSEVQVDHGSKAAGFTVCLNTVAHTLLQIERYHLLRKTPDTELFPAATRDSQKSKIN